MEELNSVQKFYAGKTIFITGASGFMGKVLLEKLLYSCSDVKEIIILMRAKRGQSALERVEKFKNLELFKARLLSEKPDSFSKIYPVVGELTQPDFGMSPNDLKRVLNTTEIVFHLAASVKNEATLRYNVLFNIVGTKNTLALAKKMKNLVHFQHLSTAYCSPEPEKVEERVYEHMHDPDELIRMSEWMTDDAMAAVQKELLGVFANTYLYTKRLAEILVTREHKNMPISIIRPPGVMPTFAEPVPGWVDSLNGVVGIFVAAGRGVLRSMLVQPNAKIEIVAVDVAIAGMIMIVKYLSTTERWVETPVYNLSIDESQKQTMKQTFDQIVKYGDIYPFSWALWYPNGAMTTSRFVHWYRTFFFQLVPAYFIDFLLLCTGQKRFMIHVQRKIKVGCEVLEVFLFRPWFFHQKNFPALIQQQSQSEHQMFAIDTLSFKDQDKFIEKCILGGRLYCCGEPNSTIPRARIVNKIMRAMHIICQFIFYYYVITFLLKVFGLYEPARALFGLK